MAQIDVSKLADAVSAFSTDFSKFSADFATFLSNIPVSNPADQATIDSAVAALAGFDTQVQALDAQVNPAPPPPPPPPAA